MNRPGGLLRGHPAEEAGMQGKAGHCSDRKGFAGDMAPHYNDWSLYPHGKAAELGAETCTGLVLGKKYSEDIMRLYRELGCPEI